MNNMLYPVWTAQAGNNIFYKRHSIYQSQRGPLIHGSMNDALAEQESDLEYRIRSFNAYTRKVSPKGVLTLQKLYAKLRRDILFIANPSLKLIAEKKDFIGAKPSKWKVNLLYWDEKPVGLVGLRNKEDST